ncbi:MAG: hypothetical protein SFW62_06290 [Alphaproteobacteria bacterium]|nr:hypothetical protein [Alphaproteobacteria bacterium]
MSTPPKPPIFGKPEKRDWRVIIMFVLCVAVGVAVIVWLIQISPKQKALECDGGAQSLIGFGGCHTVD